MNHTYIMLFTLFAVIVGALLATLHERRKDKRK
jgi:hypothetical protein